MVIPTLMSLLPVASSFSQFLPLSLQLAISGDFIHDEYI
jgi:hypothetical protein